jgi:predicted helicase
MGWGFQKTAIANTVASLEENSRAQLIMACGTGKTRVGLKVSEKLSHRRILVLVPSIALVEQTLDMYEKYAREGYQALAVCSESQIRFMGVNFENRATTDRTEVEKFMRRKGKKIVVCTYQSQELLQGMRFDLGIFDEAHKTVGPADKAFAFALYDSNVFIRKRLFMTATPRRNIRPHRKGTVVTHDMMNKKLYGDVAYNMPFRKAVRLGVICDYKIVVSVVLDDHLRVEGTPRPLAVSMAQSMDKTKAKKVFSYHYRVDHAQNFIRHNLSAFDQTTMFHINGHQKMRERRKLMDQFKAAKRAIMTNARCLIEGVNVPAVDMVAFTHAKRSEVDIVQAVGRAMRIDSARKTTGYIYLPLFLSSYEPVEDALQRTRFDYLYEVMAAMRDQDEVFAQHLVNFTARGTGSRPRS